MRTVIFPTGRHHHAPSDRLDHRVAKILQVPSATRSRIGRGQYLTPSEHNPVGLLEEALLEVMAADPIHQRICKELGKNLPFTRLDELAHNALAKGLISQDEAAILTRAEHSRLRSINVDDFAPEELATKPVKLPEKFVKLKLHNKTTTTSHAGRGTFPAFRPLLPFVSISSIFNKIFRGPPRG